ncbi:MAG: N-acetylmuramoyl-L-alanine amidase [Bacteroidetes bacterium]|jgi:N-acetylmuramoyl-L-alanine amidase|nr:MAG: N-acetylmuramoyl-L-alanine amidase [Bacteroidota bacterium]TAF98302.1 MAG: N-acetylmuramoyl-L-alanine amidase [Bacteroidota bacterium]
MKIVTYIFFLLTCFIGGAANAQKTNTLNTIVIDAGHGGYDIGAKGDVTDEATITLAIAKQLKARLKQVLPDVKVVMTREDENLPRNVQNHKEANRVRAEIANEARGDLFISIHVNSAQSKYKLIPDGTEEKTVYVKKGRKKVAKTKTVTKYKKVRVPPTITGTETYVWASNKSDSKKQFVTKTAEDMYGESEAASPNGFTPEELILASIRTRKFFDRSILLAELVQEEFTKQGRRNLGVKQRNNEGIWVLQATAMPSILVETGFICTPDDEAYLDSENGQQEVSYAIMRAILRYKEALKNNIIK